MKLSPFLPSRILLIAILVALMTPPVCFGADPSSGPSTTIVISQVYGGGGNSGATLKNDFIELYNLGSSPVSLAGWSVQYASQNGSTWTVTPLTGTVQPGHYYLVQEAPGAGGAQNLPTPDASGSIAMSGNSAKVALVTATTPLSGTCPSSASIIDFVGYGPANCFEGTAGTASLSNTTAGLRKGEGCVDTNSNTADFKVGSPNPRNSSIAFNCSNYNPPAEVSIHAIQGSGARSPYADKDIITTGIVTARKYNGFFIQEADPGDGDATTSDGVFVFTSSTPPSSAAVGNLVQVAGMVQEYVPSGDLYSPPMTEIISPTVTVISTGNTLPAVIAIAPDPNGAADQLERFEGMRVSVAAMTVVGPTEGSVNEKTAVATSNGIFYGVLDGVARPFREAGVSVFEALPAGSPCCVPRFDENPERIRVDSDSLLGQSKLEVAPGAKLTGIVGPLDFGDRTYTIDPEAAPTVVADGILSARAVPMPNGDEFTVAAYNMERFFDSTELSGVTAAALAARVNKAALAIVKVLNLPDILAIEEMGNINSLQKIADQVNVVAAASGKEAPNYTPYLVEGNDVGGIDVGFLVKSTRVTVKGVEQVGKDTPFVWGTSTELLNDRPPLVLKGVVGTSPMSMPVTVIVNHLRSLNDIEAADGRVRAKRAAQAEFLANLIQGIQSANPLENIVSVGDYNAFEVNDGYVDVLGTIRGNPADADHVVLATEDLVNPELTDLVDMLPADERYSYSFGGNAQVLDHVLVNPPIASSLTQFAYARNNADFPESFRTDTNRPERLSDHDIPVAFFTLIDSTAPSVTCGEADGNWHATDVTIGCTAADGGSGLNSPDDGTFDLSTSVPTDTETASAETDSRNLCDKQNNCIAAGPIGGNKVDKKKPELSASATANGANYAGGWTKYPVTVTFACQDFGSGVQSVTSPITVSSEGADQVATGTCMDNVGNMSETAFNGISIDMTAPVVSVTGVSNGAVYTLGSVPTAACNTTDALSGVAQAATVNVVGGTANAVGPFTATCSGASDNAGNAAGPVSATYLVQYTFSGFLPPMEQRSSFKAGSTVPVKWALLNSNGTPITNLSAIASLQVGYNGACSGDPDGAVVDAGDAGYSGLRIAGSQFIFNWQTKGLPAGCYNLMLKLDDTSTHSVLVTLR